MNLYVSLYRASIVIICLTAHFQAEACTLMTPGQTVATKNAQPFAVSFAFPGNCFAVLNSGIFQSDISIFSVAPLTNQVSKVPGSNSRGNYNAASSTITCLAFSPLGTVLAVGSTNSQNVSGVTLFQRNPQTCGLTQIVGPGTSGIFPINGVPQALAFSPNGQFLVTVNATNTLSTISVFKIDCTSLQLTQVGSDIITNLSSLVNLAFSPNCSCLAIVDSGSCESTPGSVSKFTGQIVTYTFNSQTGALTLVQGPNANGYYDTLLLGTSQLAFSSTGSCLAVLNGGAITGAECISPQPTPGGIGLYSVNSDCSLTAIQGPNANGTFGADYPLSLSFSYDGQCLAATNQSTSQSSYSISLFSVNSSSCTLTPAAGAQNGIFYGGQKSLGGAAYSPDLTNLVVTNPNQNTITVLQTKPVDEFSKFIRATYCKPPCNPCI